MIEMKNVCYGYENALYPALSDVNLTISDGEFLGVVGHNGSGKSTLAKHLNALLLPDTGEVLVDGLSTADEDNILAIRQRVGMVFQNPDNQLVTTVVEEDVAFGPENLGVPSAEIRERVDHALLTVGMEEYASRAPHMLSGGQKQRIAIAGMLAMRPRVLVLDEATAMLDPEGRRDVLKTVRRLNREAGITVVMITQYMEEATLCDRVVVMDHGRIEAEGTPQEVFEQAEKLRAIGLDVPVMVQIREALPVKLSGKPTTVDALADALAPLLRRKE